jgi:hypothetical protein
MTKTWLTFLRKDDSVTKIELAFADGVLVEARIISVGNEGKTAIACVDATNAPADVLDMCYETVLDAAKKLLETFSDFEVFKDSDP